MDDPRVTKRAKKAHLSYELPNRIHCACICPQTAPNGSSVIVYGHERGMRMVWRGGKRRRQQPVAAAAPPKPQGGDVDMIVISDDEDEAPLPPPKITNPEYEDEEDELDPDSPWPSVTAEMDIDIGLDILHLATPAILQNPPPLLEQNALIIASDSEGSLRILTLPLSPPTDSEKKARVDRISKTYLLLPGGPGLLRGVDAKVIRASEGYNEPAWNKGQGGPAESDLLIAAVPDALQIWRFPITEQGLGYPKAPLFKTVRLPKPASKVSFHPSPRHAQMLVVESTGAVRLYDPFASPRGEDTDMDDHQPTSRIGTWLTAFTTSFNEPLSNANTHSRVASRKPLLDAKYIFNGRAILALLADGEWGIWDPPTAIQTSKSPTSFTLRGQIGGSSSSATDSSLSSKSRNTAKLAPMTPNTRAAKAQNLFSGPPKTAGLAPRGGIAVAASGRKGDEAILMHYDSAVYSIPSLQTFYQRSTSASGGIGSLYSPGLTHMSDINLVSETITAVGMFEGKVSATGQRDVLVAGEHRFVILTDTSHGEDGGKGLFGNVAKDISGAKDQQMLEAGALDLGGMDRMLSGMANRNGNGHGRKVGFAAT